MVKMWTRKNVQSRICIIVDCVNYFFNITKEIHRMLFRFSGKYINLTFFPFYLLCPCRCFTIQCFFSQPFLLINILSMLTFLTLNLVSKRLFYFLMFCPSRRLLHSVFSSWQFLLLDILSQSTFFLSSLFYPS